MIFFTYNMLITPSYFILHGLSYSCILSSISLRILVSMSTDKACICFLGKYRITNSVAIIPSASAILKYSDIPISVILFLYYKKRRCSSQYLMKHIFECVNTFSGLALWEFSDTEYEPVS